MTTLVEALSTRQLWIVYGLSPGANGKFDKIPAHPITQHAINSQDPTQHMLGADAATYAAALNLLTPRPPILTDAGPREVVAYGVGIVIAKGSGLAFIDLDHAVAPQGGWLPHVVAFEAMFPGAYRETSVSRAGRHIICSYTGEPAPHGTRNRQYGMECYTRGRFMAVGDIDVSGSPLVDCTTELTAFLLTYFPHDPPLDPGEWRTEPVPGWTGPTDDDELIARAMRSISVAGGFGKRALFRDLWTANMDVLGRIFVKASGEFDGSSADQALANHLRFWTGANCERILRLMWRSGLARDKWQREDYMQRTIMRALDDPNADVYHGQKIDEAPVTALTTVATTSVPPPPPMAYGTPAPPEAMPEARQYKSGDVPPPGTLVTISQMEQMFRGYTYVADINKIQDPKGTPLSKDRFDAMKGGPLYATTAVGDKPSKSAWDAYVLNEVHAFRRAETQCFKPQLPTGEIVQLDDRTRAVNCYFPLTIRRVEGDPAPFLDFVNKLLPNGRDAELLVAFMAACTRYLGVKFSWCVFLQGCEGNGKSTIGKILAYCCGKAYTHSAKAANISEKFNAHLLDKVLLIIDEMHTDDKNEFQELLKDLVTNDYVEIRAMHTDKVMKDVCFNILLMSNHQNALRITGNTRRYAPLFCAQQEANDLLRSSMTESYFAALWEWLDGDGHAIIYDYLMRIAIAEDFDPTRGALRAPHTTSTEAARVTSLGSIEQEIANAIEQKHDGFRGGWLSEHSLDLLLARLGKDKFIQRAARRQMVKILGYDPHPSLVEGICPVPLPEGVCTRLYIKRGHAWAVSHLTPQQVLDGFVEHQRQR